MIEFSKFCIIREPSQITFAFRGGEVVRKMLDLLDKKGKIGWVKS